MSDPQPPHQLPPERRSSFPSRFRAPGPSHVPPSRVRASSGLVPGALFLLTFLTTTAAGAIHQHPGVDISGWQVLFPVGAIRPISDGLSYSVPLMLILLCHELGHYFVARAHGVQASLPHFIPLPPLLGFGTMGAIIGMRQVTSDRRKLIDIGAAGPLAGLLVAIPVIAYGLSLSPVGTLHPGGMQEGNSVLYAVVKRLAKGVWLPDGTHDVFLHPTAYAGWVGLLITMINLLPIGQLDGGHIATAYFGNGYGRFARRLHQALPVMAVAVFWWVTLVVRREIAGTNRATTGEVFSIAAQGAMPWMVWWLMVTAVRRLSGSGDHPPVEALPLGASRRRLFWLMVVVFALLLMPVPMRQTLAGVDRPPPPPDRLSAPAAARPASSPPEPPP